MARQLVKTFLLGGIGGNNIDTQSSDVVIARRNPFSMSDEEILDLICPTHQVDINTSKFDVESLVAIVDNILIRSTQVADNENHGSLEVIDDKITQASFKSPLCTFKKISYLMSCKDPGEDVAHNTTLEILNTLPKHSWVAKAVVTFGAFAHEYGELWLLSQYQPTEPLAKSLATLKRVPEFTLQKHRKDILELNNLVKDAWEVIKLVSKMDKNHRLTLDAKVDVPDLETALQQIPVDVYWIIITITSIATQIDCLIDDVKEKLDLSQFSQRIKAMLKQLKTVTLSCDIYLAEAHYFQMLDQVFKTPTPIMEVFKLLIFRNDTPQTPIYDCHKKAPVSIEVLKNKNLFLFFSTLDITEDQISIFNPIDQHIKKQEHQYTIVWVPIVKGDWTEDLKQKFYTLKSKMSWYVLEHFETIKGIKYIEEKWQFQKEPMVVVLSNQGTPLHPNAFHMIQVHRLNGFPFTEEKERELNDTNVSILWIQDVLIEINVPELNDWIKKQETFILCGGEDKGWIDQFKQCAGDQINVYYFEAEEHISNFWKQVEILFMAMIRTKSTTVIKQVQKLLSYKQDKFGWSLLIRGSTVLLVAQGTTIIKIVAREEFPKEVEDGGFVTAIVEAHLNLVEAPDKIPVGCSHIEVPAVGRRIPEPILCSECEDYMEVIISYKCCHKAKGKQQGKKEPVTEFVILDTKESIANFVAHAARRA